MAGLFKFRCPHCYREYTGMDELRGNEFDCVGCGEELLVPIKPEDINIPLEETTCKVCGSPLDLLGECQTCKKKADLSEERKQEGKPAKEKVVRDPVMAKVMKARRPGMKNIIPEEKAEPENASKRTRRRKRK